LPLNSTLSDHVIARVDVRGVGRAMLAHQHHGDVGGEPPDATAARVDDPPPLLDLTGLGHERLHLSLDRWGTRN
jgi:hypothetical protein